MVETALIVIQGVHMLIDLYNGAYLAVDLKDFVVETSFSPKVEPLCCSSSFTFT